MRIKLQTPSGSSIVTLPASATVGDLLSCISEQMRGQRFETKFGFPPKALRLDTLPRSKPLAELDERLDGGQLLVSLKDGGHADGDVDNGAAAEGGKSGVGTADIKAPVAKRPTLQSS
ncbi:hypothetical protein GP486_008736, partial [Trichoglossum hirsutum]